MTDKELKQFKELFPPIKVKPTANQYQEWKEEFLKIYPIEETKEDDSQSISLKRDDEKKNPFLVKIMFFIGVVAFIFLNIAMCSEASKKGVDPNFYPRHTQNIENSFLKFVSLTSLMYEHNNFS